MSDDSMLLHTDMKKFHFNNEYFLDPQPFEYISLYQVGDLSCNGGYEIESHRQYCYEISYIVSGKGHYYTNGKAYFVKEGDIYLSLPGEVHTGIADSVDPFRFFYVGFNFCSDEVEKNPFAHIRKMFDQIKEPVMHDKMDIKTYFVKIFHELINVKDYSNFLINTFLHQIIVLAYRDFFDGWEKDYMPEKTVDNTKQIIYQLINYIDNNLYEIDKLELATEKLGYSYSYLSHIFTKETGLTIQKYFCKKRFEKALEWLTDGNTTITEIAGRLQYQSIHSFSKAFKKYLGISPTQYQCLYREKAKNDQLASNQEQRQE